MFEIVKFLHRANRGQAGVAILRRHLRFAGAKIVTRSEGEIGERHVGLKASRTHCS